jgi:hypothetical protein
MVVSCLAYSSTLKAEATFSFETSVDFQRTTRSYIFREQDTGFCSERGFLLGLLFDPESGGNILLRNVGWLSTYYTALYLQKTRYWLLLRERFLAWLTLRPWRQRQHSPSKRRLTFNGLHGAVSSENEILALLRENERPSYSFISWPWSNQEYVYFEHGALNGTHREVGQLPLTRMIRGCITATKKLPYTQISVSVKLNTNCVRSEKCIITFAITFLFLRSELGDGSVGLDLTLGVKMVRSASAVSYKLHP